MPPESRQPNGHVRHVPMRRCVVCRDSRPQAELLRLVQDDAGAWQLDLKRKASGRGAWLCRDRAACRRPKALKRFFRAQAERVAQEVAALGAMENRTDSDIDMRTASKANTGDGGINAR